MTNASILANSLNQWAMPIMNAALNNLAENSYFGNIASQLPKSIFPSSLTR